MHKGKPSPTGLLIPYPTGGKEQVGFWLTQNTTCKYKTNALTDRQIVVYTNMRLNE